MRASELSVGDKFILRYNGKKYKHCGAFKSCCVNTQKRIKVKAVGHCTSPVLGKDMTNISIAVNSSVDLVKDK